mmetsp:Transcript_6974/g.7650  ORF Transcript_6974/g.7650 Transcript_6974/m.7650 type:complete len:718 (+) Transcript_6974:516-2669(+)
MRSIQLELIHFTSVTLMARINLDDEGCALTSEVDTALFKAGFVQHHRPTKEQVETRLSKQIEKSDKASSTLPYNKDLVRKETSSEPEFVEDLNKATVWVVAGESGSGKSTYGMKMFAGSHVLRHSLIQPNLETPPPQESSSPTLRTFLELVTADMFDKRGYVMTGIYSAVRDVAKLANTERNNWALKLAKNMLESAANDADDDDKHNSVRDWYDRSEWGGKDITLDKLVLVFDECGRSPEFTVGIIAKARDLLKDLHSKGLAKELALVLCGSGLEAVKTGTKGNKYIGSDQALTTVITMLDTNLMCLENEDVRNAIIKGVYSRIAATNARMLANGVLPVLNSNIVNKYTDDNTWGDKASRLQAFCSFRYATDFSVRAYVHLNGLADEKERRGKLLDKAFYYMLKSALKSMSDDHKNVAVSSQLEEMDKKDKAGEEVDEEVIFRVGLATRDLSKTSSALRYLACKGKTAPMYVKDGIAFENVVAVHLHRYSESLGTKTDFMMLQSAWPPAVEKGVNLDKKKISEKVADMVTNGSADVTMIVDFFQTAIAEAGDRSVALVLRQGVPTAQGADVMKFEAKNDKKSRLEKTVLEVSTYQAKNWTSTRYKKNMSNAAKSLGMDAENKNCESETDSAGYSYGATLALCKAVAKSLKMESEIVNRVIVFPYEDSKRSVTDDQLLQGCNVQIWSKEMLEPTISALVVAPDGDEQEGIIKDTEKDA